MVTPAVTETQTLPIEQALVTQPEVVVEPLTPEPSPAPVPTPSLTPTAEVAPAQTLSEVQILRRQLAQVQAEKAQFEAEKQAQATEATLQQEALAVRQEAVARGLSDEDAQWFGQRYYAVAKRVSQERAELRQEQEYQQGKRNAAAHYGRQYGVDPSILMVANTEQDMIAIAEMQKRYAAQEVRLKALEQARVPAQGFDASTGSRAGGLVATADNIDKLWLDHETQHPGTPNPYDAPYRKFLNG